MNQSAKKKYNTCMEWNKNQLTSFIICSIMKLTQKTIFQCFDKSERQSPVLKDEGNRICQKEK